MRLWRAHGLGNDYLVLEDGPELDAELVRAICDRHRGVGSDGILEPVSTGRADHGVVIWNPDGSIAEKSGNGLRILARWLSGERGAGDRFTVWTGRDVVACEVDDDVIAVEMGRASLDPAAVPVLADGPVRDARWTVAGASLAVTVVSMGNPHCVVFVQDEDLDALPWREWGALLEVDPRFPNRTNVQVARVVPDGVELRIWERGAGPTLASGSSSCAAVVAAVSTGRKRHGRHVAHMPGGRLSVEVREDLRVRLVGPVEVVGRFTVDPAWLARRERGA